MSETHNNEKKDRRDPDFTLDCCEDVMELLFDYMGRELGDSRSAFVREHLRMCPQCQASAAEIQTALDALNAERKPEEVPEHLSDDRRRRLAWAVMHPFLDWVYRHHVAVSWVMVTVVLTAVACALLVIRQDREVIDTTLPVIIKADTPPAALEENVETPNRE